MRIATWNLERGGRTRAAAKSQDEVLRSLAADIVVLTEPPASIHQGPGIVTAPLLRAGRKGLEAWVAIVGSCITNAALEIPFARMAAAALATVDGRSVAIYGSVLPWRAIRHQAPELVRPGESAQDAFLRILHEQVADIVALREHSHPDLIVWAGDFNQTLSGSCMSGSAMNQRALVDALADLGFDAWNKDSSHATEGLCAIDLICGPRERRPTRRGRIDPVRDGVVMSDHAGYWIEF